MISPRSFSSPAASSMMRLYPMAMAASSSTEKFVSGTMRREPRGREVLVADHAAITVDVDVRDLAHEQHTALNLAGVAHEFVDLAQRVVVLFVLLVYFHRLLEVLQHALRRRGGVYHFIGGVDDTLCEVRGVGDDPLGAGCPCAEEQPHQKECQTSFHSYSTGVSNSSAAGCVASSGRNRP